MVCEPCRQDRHQMCREGDCGCPRRAEDQQIDQSMTASRQGDEALAEMIYSSLAGCATAQMLTGGAGKSAVKLFIQQVLRAYRAVRC